MMTAPDPRATDPRGSLDRHALAFVGVVTAARLWFAWVADLELFGDEAQYWAWSREPAWGYFSKPPLLAWLIHLSTSVFGDSELAVRAASPLLHAVTALVVGATARRLHGARAGFWGAALYATLPSVSLSSLLISTDVPLLLFWSVALYAWVRLREGSSPRGRLALTLTLGLAAGFGLLAKYAMVYFWLCVPLSIYASRPNRAGLAGGSIAEGPIAAGPIAGGPLSAGPLSAGALSARALLAAALSFAVLAPNLAWNGAHDFVTFHHTATNAGVGAARFRPGAALEFLGAQLGVIGPVLAVLWLGWLAKGRLTRTPADRALVPFQVVPLLIILPVAFLRRANANWAATMLPALCVQCAALAAFPAARRWLKVAVASSLALAVVALGAAPLGEALGRPLPGQLDPWRRLRGGRALALEVTRALDATPGAGLVSDERMTLAVLAYYLGPEREHPWSFTPDGAVRHHFDLAWPLRGPNGRTFLFLTRRDAEADLARTWTRVERRADIEVPVAAGMVETYRLYEVE
ncbi:MAG: glycosyltransferase family 39 protein [Planctomycetota bacterium]